MTEIWRGDLAKMAVAKASGGEPVQYYLGDEGVLLNDYLGKEITCAFTGEIHCRVCGKSIPKAYGEGYCFPHFKSDPANAPCVVRPELCEAHEGRGRDPEWERANHDQPHVVYLANSGGLKVGVTRATNVPSRWIDQGAIAACVLANVPHRRLAGEIEVSLKEHVSDKTRWQKMLTAVCDDEIDLIAHRDELSAYLAEEHRQYLSTGGDVEHIEYPVHAWPEKVKSVNFDKVAEISGVLRGIRGQYLIFDDQRVFNVRRHTGYESALRVSQ